MAKDCCGSVNAKAASTPHPLDPLSVKEVEAATTLVRKHLTEKTQVKAVKMIYVQLIEPNKLDVLAYLGIPTEPGISAAPNTSIPIPRKVEVCLLDALTGLGYEAVVHLPSPASPSASPKTGEPTLVGEPARLPEGAHPAITLEELEEAEKIVRDDPQVQKICADVGVKKDEICADGWSLGYDDRFGKGNERRLQQCFMYARFGSHDNLYAHPLDFIVVVDTISAKVVYIDFAPHRVAGPNKDQLSVPTTHPAPVTTDPAEALKNSGRDRIPPPTEPYDYLPDLLTSQTPKTGKPFKVREDLKPLHVVQPEGVSFTMDGNRLKWQKWDMHIGFNWREGIVLNTITYDDDGTVRPLFYRMSLAEMVVPYGAPESPHPRKFAFDVGEYGLGNQANALALGCDCLGAIQYIDGVNVGHDGRAAVIENAICIHEEDAGMLWKHTDYRQGGRAHAVRARKLVISMVCTVANYEYKLAVSFFQDGSIQVETQLTGILNIYVLAEGESPSGFGTEVAPRVLGHYHSHTFSLRVDPMIDGINNSVVQTDLVQIPDPTGSEKNYLGNGFTTEKKVLRTTGEGAVDYDHSKNRTWSIVNPNKTHYASKQPVGYKIMCKDMPPFMCKPDSMVAKRAPFTKHDLFVTPYVHGQFYPAGRYVPQTVDTPEDSILNWMKGDKNIENTDIALYLTYGVNHVVRPEDWPVMPRETLEIFFKPVGFFRQNPALDVPQVRDGRSVSAFGKSPAHCAPNGANGHTNGVNGGVSGSNGTNGH